MRWSGLVRWLIGGGGGVGIVVFGFDRGAIDQASGILVSDG